jgi:hypothetical protein
MGRDISVLTVSYRRMIDCANQLKAKKGSFYDKWKDGMKRARERKKKTRKASLERQVSRRIT